MRYKVLAGAMLVGAGCGASTLLAFRPTPPSRPSLRAEVTSRPNNPEFRGGSLENCDVFKYEDAGVMTASCIGDDGGPQARTLYLADAGAAPCQQAKADAGWVGGGSYTLYTVTSDAGDMCQGTMYSATVNEIDDQCSDADIDKLSGKAIVVPGYWDKNGNYHNDRGMFTVSCISGVVAKCIHWGYLPDDRYLTDGGPDGGTELLGYYRACVRAARASYSNKERDKAFTCNGAVIDIYDKLDIQRKTDAGAKTDPRNGKMSCESTWSGDDAGDSLTFLARPRYDFFEDAGDLADAGVKPADAGCDSGLLSIQSFVHEAPNCEQPIQVVGLKNHCLAAVDARDGGACDVKARPCSSSPYPLNEQFVLINVLGHYQFQVQGCPDEAGRRRCLAIDGKIAPDAGIVAEPCNAHKRQQFSMIGADAGADRYNLQISPDKEGDPSDPKDGGPYCVGVADGDAGNEAPIVLQECDGGDARQQFHFVF